MYRAVAWSALRAPRRRRPTPRRWPRWPATMRHRGGRAGGGRRRRCHRRHPLGRRRRAPCRPWRPTRPCAPSWWRANGPGWPSAGGAWSKGRDIGTVVLPDADLKVYLTAATETRARRRADQRADGRSVDEVDDDLVRRDRLDSTRLASPLPSPEDVAEDAIVIDSTGKSSRGRARGGARMPVKPHLDVDEDAATTRRRAAVRVPRSSTGCSGCSSTSSTGSTGGSRSTAPTPSRPRAR